MEYSTSKELLKMENPFQKFRYGARYGPKEKVRFFLHHPPRSANARRRYKARRRFALQQLAHKPMRRRRYRVAVIYIQYVDFRARNWLM